MWGLLTRSVQFAVRQIPLVLMVWGFAFAFFMYGFLVSDRHWFPYESLVQARTAALFIRNRKIMGDGVPEIRASANVSSADVKQQRMVAREPVEDGDPLLLTGGEGQFLDYCPEHGCAAVIVQRDGTALQTYPYRPEELTTKRTLAEPYAELLHDDSQDTAVFGLAPLANGDLIVVYDFNGTSPYGGGIARMDKDGHLLWYRRDYSNHWPKITPSNEILVISHKIGATSLPLYGPRHKARIETLTCASGILHDVIRILDLDGNALDEIPIFEALLAFPYWSRLVTGADPLRPLMTANLCDPLHANSVVPVGRELAAKFADVEPDDVLVSLRNLSALAIFGRAGHSLKHLFVGTFIYQHSAQVVSGGNVLLFDNFGSSEAGGPSRVLLFDPLTREERTVFPNKHTPKDLDVFSPFFGNIDISEDGTRALLTIATAGKAYEIGLADGRILTTFDNLHDLHTLPQFARSEKPVRYFTQYGVYYMPRYQAH